MKGRALLVALVALGACGCGSSQQASAPKPPKLPRALAQSWAQQADAVAVAIDAGDGCTALHRAVALRTQVVEAVNAHRVPRRYLESLVGTTNDLAGRIACTPPAQPPVATKHGQGHEKRHKQDQQQGDGGD